MSLAFNAAAQLPGLQHPTKCPTTSLSSEPRRLRRTPPPLNAPTPPTASLQPPSSNLGQSVLKALGVAAASTLLLTATPALPASWAPGGTTPGPGPGAARAAALVATPFRLAPAHAPDPTTMPGALQAHWDLHSTACDTETFVVLSNETSNVIDLLWVDYVGKEVFYASINPGMTYLQQSFASHPWVVRDHVSQNSVLVLVATPEPLMAVVHAI